MIDALYSYEELSQEAKQFARSNILATIFVNYQEKLNKLIASGTKESIHSRINNRTRYRVVINQLAFTRKCQTASQQWFEKLIMENLCQFDSKGRFYQFTKKAFFPS